MAYVRVSLCSPAPCSQAPSPSAALLSPGCSPPAPLPLPHTLPASCLLLGPPSPPRPPLLSQGAHSSAPLSLPALSGTPSPSPARPPYLGSLPPRPSRT